MSDSNTSSEDRQLPASQRRLDKAAGQGQVVRSRDLVHLTAIVASMAALSLLGAGMTDKLVKGLRQGLTLSHTQAFEHLSLADHFASLTVGSYSAVMPMMLLVVAACALAAMLPGGPAWTLHPLRLDPSRLSPLAGIKRIVSLQALTDLGKLAGFALLLSAVAVLYLLLITPQFQHLARVALEPALFTVAGLLRNAGWVMCTVLLLATAIDVPLQWNRLRGSLRMSHQDARDEHKETEGDPAIKSRIRGLQLQMRRKQMMAAVPKADVIITNPAHYAVAIRYDEKSAGAPMVIAKGMDHLATRIREIAQGCEIPLVEAPPLARALYRHVEIDQPIPAALYQAVAQVLAYVYQLRQWRSGKGRTPSAPAHIDLPAGLDPNEQNS